MSMLVLVSENSRIDEKKKSYDTEKYTNTLFLKSNKAYKHIIKYTSKSNEQTAP